jgi:hypothetical protein
VHTASTAGKGGNTHLLLICLGQHMSLQRDVAWPKLEVKGGWTEVPGNLSNLPP